MPASLARPDYALADNLTAARGTDLPHRHAGADPPRADAARARRARRHEHRAASSAAIAARRSAWSISRRGRRAKLLDAAGVRFLPAINEELGGTAVLGTQRVESDPERTVEGVFAMWYGKGPGVDRAGDALKHGNAYGSSPHGGVLVVAGDDHGCVSSSMPHQSDSAMSRGTCRCVNPANIAEYLEFGLVRLGAVALLGRRGSASRRSRKRSKAARRSTSTRPRARRRWKDAAAVAPRPASSRPPDGLHNRWPDLPSLKIEARLHAKLDAVRALRASQHRSTNGSRRAAHANVGIVTCGKAHLDLMETFRRLDLPLADARRRRRAHLQGRPGVSARDDAPRCVRRRARRSPGDRGEGPGWSSSRCKDYCTTARRRAADVVGKQRADGAPLVSELGELRPSRADRSSPTGSPTH